MAGSRAAGTNPRATGTNPRAGGAGAASTGGPPGAPSGAGALLGAQMQVAALEAQLAQFRLINAQQDSADKKQKTASALQGRADKSRVADIKKQQKEQMQASKNVEKWEKRELADWSKKRQESKQFYRDTAKGALVALGTVGALYAGYLKIYNEYHAINSRATSNAKIMHGSFSDMVVLQQSMRPMDQFLNLPEGWSEGMFGRMRDDLGVSAKNATALLTKLQTFALNSSPEQATKLADSLIDVNKRFREAKQSGWEMRLTSRQISDMYMDMPDVQRQMIDEMNKYGKSVFDAKEYNRMMNDFLDSSASKKLPNPADVMPAWEKLEIFLKTNILSAIDLIATSILTMGDNLNEITRAAYEQLGDSSAPISNRSWGGFFAGLMGETNAPTGQLTEDEQLAKDRKSASVSEMTYNADLNDRGGSESWMSSQHELAQGSLAYRLRYLREQGATDAGILSMGLPLTANDRGGLVTGVSGGIANVRPAHGEGLASIGVGERIVPAGGGFSGGNITIHQTNHLAVNEAASGKDLAQDFALESAQAFVQQLALAGVGVGA